MAVSRDAFLLRIQSGRDWKELHGDDDWHKCVLRVNVMQDGAKFVWSDTMGVLRDRVGHIHMTKSCKAYPVVLRT